VRWSVSVVAEGDRVVSHDEVLALADAVAISGGIASGIGTPRYGAQLLVDAEDRASAEQVGRAEFARAVAEAGLPTWPVTHIVAISEAEDDLDGLE
jgi:hypothetical protein